MVKQKQSKKKRQSSGVDPEDGEWIEVKKQRVIILIPALSTIDHHSISPARGEAQIQEMAIGTNPHMQCFSGNPSPKHSAHNEEKSMPPPSEATTIHPSETTPVPHIPSTPPPQKISAEDSPVHMLINGENRGVSRYSKMMKDNVMYDLCCTFPNQMMKRAYLEKKIKMAGGLENWLVSLGLSHFVKIFRQANSYHLANLTMEKLKDMGAVAVGPRRKLLHAIDCLCEPNKIHHELENFG